MNVIFFFFFLVLQASYLTAAHMHSDESKTFCFVNMETCLYSQQDAL